MRNTNSENSDIPRIKLFEKEDREMFRNFKAFKETNEIWNRLGFNATAEVGNLMYLIKLSGAKTFEEWEKFYIKSGHERQGIIARGYNRYYTRDLDIEYGRTVRQLANKARTFADATGIDIAFAFNSVYIRIIDETWLGYQRELKAIKLLNKNKNIIVKNVDYKKDVKYAVDFEVFIKDELILGIQLKSTKYKRFATQETKDMNIRKNNLYKNSEKVNVLYLYMDNDNDVIVNMDEYDNSIINLLTQ